MRKINHIKNSLIAEYAKIKHILNFLNSMPNENIFSEVRTKYESLCATYDKLFFRLKMLDLSFALLKRELSADIGLNIPSADPYIAIEILNKIYPEFVRRAHAEIDALTFNEFEKYYLLSM